MYVLWYDEKVDKAKQGSEDEGEDHGAGEVLIGNLVVLCDARDQRRSEQQSITRQRSSEGFRPEHITVPTRDVSASV